PIVAYSDTPWKNTLRQKLNSLVSCFYVKKAFTHLWVSGIRQYDYARKLGFSNDRIILNSLSADVDLFSKTNMELKKQDYPKKFIYIGRFVKIKGLENLLNAWDSINEKEGWTLTIIGAGDLKE